VSDSGACQVSLGFLSSFEFFFIFSGFFQVQSFFGFQIFLVSDTPTGEKQNPHQTQLCAGWVQIQVTGAKMHLNPHRQV
jgi:hypothetical protein